MASPRPGSDRAHCAPAWLGGYLDALGYETAATCETVASALAQIDPARIDVAIVDVHLANGEFSGPVIDAVHPRPVGGSARQPRFAALRRP